MGSGYETLIFHTEFTWLSRGKVLITVFQMTEGSVILSLKKVSQIYLRCCLVTVTGVPS
jgi:hypothetical protein